MLASMQMFNSGGSSSESYATKGSPPVERDPFLDHWRGSDSRATEFAAYPGGGSPTTRASYYETLGYADQPDHPRLGQNIRTSFGAVLFNLSFIVNLVFYCLLASAGYDAMKPGGGHSKHEYDEEISWFEALGDCVGGDKPWERREYASFVGLGALMIGSGAYLQWLVLVFNEDPHRLSLSTLPESVKRRVYWSLLVYLMTSFSLALLVVGFTYKKFSEQLGGFHPEHRLYKQYLNEMQGFLQVMGIIFVLGGALAIVQREVRDVVKSEQRKII